MTAVLGSILLVLAQAPSPGDRLAYLDGEDPYYVHRGFAKLVTPQWVGEPGVEAVVVLAIDDMRGHEKWEAYLRPILERLKQIDGRAPVSIMTCSIDPNHPHLQKWLKEGLSIEAHTVDHPCPLLQGGSLAKAKSTYDRCVDLLNLVPGNRPVAFRMPCCDSLNTPSPRFYSEIFNRTTPHGNFLSIDTSVFNITTSLDPELPPELVRDPEGGEKFRKYLPFPSFVNTIEDYPYPYVLGNLCWEFPCVVPSDWEAQNLRKPNHPKTVSDLKDALDGVVRKRGTFNLVFHPHGWIKPEQIVELIDHAVEKHGKGVKFLTFREALERLNGHLLGGSALRRPDGSDQGVRLIDVNNDGYLDVVKAGDAGPRETRVWDPARSVWTVLPFPETRLADLRFGVLDPKAGAACMVGPEGTWTFTPRGWTRLPVAATPDHKGALRGAGGAGWLRDLDGDGTSELISGKEVFRWTGEAWARLPFEFPEPQGRAGGADSGLRFVDLKGRGRWDLVLSNDERWAVYAWADMSRGWELLSSGKPGDPGALPLIVRGGASNGAWFHSRHLWVQNEDTAKMPNLVDRRSFDELLRKP
jgi:hypothetical protein